MSDQPHDPQQPYEGAGYPPPHEGYPPHAPQQPYPPHDPARADHADQRHPAAPAPDPYAQQPHYGAQPGYPEHPGYGGHDARGGYGPRGDYPAQPGHDHGHGQQAGYGTQPGYGHGPRSQAGYGAPRGAGAPDQGGYAASPNEPVWPSYDDEPTAYPPQQPHATHHQNAPGGYLANGGYPDPAAFTGHQPPPGQREFDDPAQAPADQSWQQPHPGYGETAPTHQAHQAHPNHPHHQTHPSQHAPYAPGAGSPAHGYGVDPYGQSQPYAQSQPYGQGYQDQQGHQGHQGYPGQQGHQNHQGHQAPAAYAPYEGAPQHAAPAPGRHGGDGRDDGAPGGGDTAIEASAEAPADPPAAAPMTAAEKARAEGRPQILGPGLQPALLTAVLAGLLAVAAPVAEPALAVAVVLLQAVTAAGWFRLNGMWPARQGIALAFLGGVAADIGLLTTDRDQAPTVLIGTLGCWLLLVIVLQLRNLSPPDERLYGLTATATSAALAVVAAGYLATEADPVVIGAAGVCIAALARALPLPGAVSVLLALAASGGAGFAVGRATDFGTSGAALGLAAGACALIGLRVASYDYPSRFVHLTAGVALPLTAAAPAVYLLGRTLG
ncbi:hypothetical protein [Streptomyces buecherae]|uniref:Uncharacterized protein n=1 Tax=Streptomyces buecherae TaxID=2763006 RepID=A0A7H8N8H5_9ACTN|nr:hypothetical protein HUT08_15105 [Streptomyces buecherae]